MRVLFIFLMTVMLISCGNDAVDDKDVLTEYVDKSYGLEDMEVEVEDTELSMLNLERKDLYDMLVRKGLSEEEVNKIKVKFVISRVKRCTMEAGVYKDTCVILFTKEHINFLRMYLSDPDIPKKA